MGLVSYTNIEDNVTDVSANELNQRFGAIISQLNGNLDSANFKAGGIPASAIAGSVFAAMWPVGSVYINATDNTNPGTLFGFGTWEAFGAGRVPVGYDASQTEFNAAGKTGGHKVMQAHNHSGTTGSNGEHSHGMPNYYQSSGGSGRNALSSGSGLFWGNPNTGSAGAHTHTFTTDTAGSGDSGNLQPYITVYIWKRTS